MIDVWKVKGEGESSALVMQKRCEGGGAGTGI
jgi:hypothetical protein